MTIKLYQHWKKIKIIIGYRRNILIGSDDNDDEKDQAG